MTFSRRLLVVPAIALLWSASLQAAETMKPGLWEYSTRMEMPGMPMQMPPAVVQNCLKPEDIAGERAYQPDNNKDCKIENMKTSGNTVSYDVKCVGTQPANGRYEFTSTATTMKGKGAMEVQGRTMLMNIEARRLGDCP